MTSFEEFFTEQTAFEEACTDEYGTGDEGWPAGRRQAAPDSRHVAAQHEEGATHGAPAQVN